MLLSLLTFISYLPMCIEPFKVEQHINTVNKQLTHSELVQKWYEISNGDIDFILTVQAESWWSPKAIGDKWLAHWLCQWNERWHKDITRDINFKSPEWQLKKCFEYYSNYKKKNILHKRLYWYNHRNKYRHLFTFN